MLDKELYESFNLLDVGVVEKLDNTLRSKNNMETLSVPEIINSFPDNSEIADLLIGLWSFEFLKNPIYVGDKLKSYNNFLDKEDVSAVVRGLVSVIRHCHVEHETDIHAVDYHYSAIGKLYRLLGEQSEEVIYRSLEKNPSISLIDALGVLVGHEMKGSLSAKSIFLLKEITMNNRYDLSKVAKRVLEEDVARVMGSY